MLRIILIVFILGPIFCTGCGGNTQDTITAREIRIVDSKGRPRIVLGIFGEESDEAAITLKTPDGKTLVLIGGSSGKGGLVSVSDGNPPGAVMLLAPVNSDAGLLIFDEKGDRVR